MTEPLKVLLINPPDNLHAFLGQGAQFMPVLEPLGLLSIAAYLRAACYDVRVLDAFAMNFSVDRVKAFITENKPHVIGLTSFISNGEVVYEIGQWVKKIHPDIFVVLGNVHAAAYAEGYLRSGCADCVVHGDGEEVFVRILKERASHGSLEGIPALSLLINGHYRAPSECAVVNDLTALPLPARDMVESKFYNFPNITNMPYSYRLGRVAKHMFTSRGCPFNCSFCVVQKGHGRRCYSVDQVLEEIQVLLEKYHTNYIFFMDPIFAVDKERVLELCRRIKQLKLKFRWGCEGHVNSIDEQMIREMESAGCHDMAFGIESGVQRILDSVHKGIQLADIEKGMRLIKAKTRIKVSGLFILGLPGEMYEDALTTIAFAKKLPLDMAQFSIFVPYPGSALFYSLVQKGEIDTGIRDDGTLNTSIWKRYSAYIAFTGNAPIWVTPGLTAEELRVLQKRAIKEFYFRPRQFLYQLQRLSFSEMAKAFSAFGAVLEDPSAQR